MIVSQLTQTLELDVALPVASGTSCRMPLDVLTWDDVDVKYEAAPHRKERKPI